MMIPSVATMEKITEDVDEDEEEEAGDHGEYERRRRILIVEAGRIFCCRGENNNRTTVVCDVVNRWKDGQTDKALIIIELFEESLFLAISLFHIYKLFYGSKPCCNYNILFDITYMYIFSNCVL